MFDDNRNKTQVKIWCDGRNYNASTECYYPIYSYSITTKNWNYDANDIFGAANEMPNLDFASRSLFAFLLACVEAQPGSENYDLFPEHVREWADYFSEQITIKYLEYN